MRRLALSLLFLGCALLSSGAVFAQFGGSGASAPTFSGGTISSGTAPTLANGIGYIIPSVTGGIIMGGQGSGTDFQIRNRSGTTVLSVGTGGSALSGLSLNLTSSPFVSVGQAAIGGGSTTGGIYGGSGSVTDVVLENKNAAIALSIPTGTINVNLPGLTASLPVCTDSSKNLSTTCPGDAPVLSGTTGSIGGGVLLAGACTSGTVAVTSSTTAMSVVATPVTYPGDGVTWAGYVSTAGTVTVKVCAIVGLTPTASAYNVRVIQ